MTSLQESAADVTNSLVMKTFAELERTSFSKKQSAVYAKSNSVKRALELKRGASLLASVSSAAVSQTAEMATSGNDVSVLRDTFSSSPVHGGTATAAAPPASWLLGCVLQFCMFLVPLTKRALYVVRSFE